MLRMRALRQWMSVCACGGPGSHKRSFQRLQPTAAAPAETQAVAPQVTTAAQKPSGELTMDEMVDQLEVDDQPCMPPRFEPWRLCERIIANCAAVFVWVGVWDQVRGAATNIVLPARADHSLTAPPAWPRTDRHECVATAVQLQRLWPLL
jgi:hypothetical protein